MYATEVLVARVLCALKSRTPESWRTDFVHLHKVAADTALCGRIAEMKMFLTFSLRSLVRLIYFCNKVTGHMCGLELYLSMRSEL